MTRVLLAEDQHVVRRALVALIDLEDDLHVVADVARGDAVVAAALETDPHVAVLDIDLPGLDGLSAARLLQDRVPSCRVLVLSGLTQPHHLLRALEQQVHGFLSKAAPSGDLVDAVRQVAAGRRVLDPELVAAALAAGPSPLTPRETDVLRMASRGSPRRRSPRRSSSPRRPCATTCPPRWPSSARATASTRWASPIGPAGSDPRGRPPRGTLGRCSRSPGPPARSRRWSWWGALALAGAAPPRRPRRRRPRRAGPGARGRGRPGPRWPCPCTCGVVAHALRGAAPPAAGWSLAALAVLTRAGDRAGADHVELPPQLPGGVRPAGAPGPLVGAGPRGGPRARLGGGCLALHLGRLVQGVSCTSCS